MGTKHLPSLLTACTTNSQDDPSRTWFCSESLLKLHIFTVQNILNIITKLHYRIVNTLLTEYEIKPNKISQK